MNHNLNRRILHCTIILCAFAMRNAACYSQMTAISPAEFANVEMPDLVEITQTSYRLQQVYSASDFSHLGPGPFTITRLDFRPDGDTSGQLSYARPSWTMKLSTTAKDPGDLSPTFVDNIGPDVVAVVDGEVAISTQNVGPDGGPKAFDYGLDLDTPFVFDPGEGNLLLDWTILNAVGELSVDFSVPATSTTSFYWTGSLGHTSTVADQSSGQFGGHAIQFTVVPEPSSALLALVAVATICASRRRRG